MSREIPLSQGKVAIVDDADYDALVRHKWHAHKSNGGYYAQRKANGTHRAKRADIAMHRQIMAGPGTGRCIDHINRDTLDNRRSNLRVCTNAENHWNHRPYSHSASRFRGVSTHRAHWRAQIYNLGRPIHIGYFASELEAAIGYDRTCKRLRGQFACPNFSSVVSRRNLREWLSRTGGRFFTVCFIKRGDGSERTMLCRIGVSPAPGPSILQMTEGKNLFSVWDVQKRQFRYISIEGILWILSDGHYIRPSRPPRSARRDATGQGLLFALTAG